MLTQDEFAAKFNVSASELERYASLGLLFPNRTDGHVLYDDRSVLRMHIIAKGMKLGFSLEAIKKIIESTTAG